MDFGEALQGLRDGYRVRRAGWNGKGMWIRLVRRHGTLAQLEAGEGSKLRLLDYIEMKTATDELVPWLASQTDVLAEDWEAA